MMSIEEALVAHLGADVALAALITGPDSAGQTKVKIYGGFVPEETTTPAIAYDLTGQEHVMTHSGPAGIMMSTLQVHCLATTNAAAKALSEAVHDAAERSTEVWGDVPVSRVHATPAGATFSVELQEWTVPVTIEVNHRG
jgi:hypothetical protein